MLTISFPRISGFRTLPENNIMEKLNNANTQTGIKFIINDLLHTNKQYFRNELNESNALNMLHSINLETSNNAIIVAIKNFKQEIAPDGSSDRLKIDPKRIPYLKHSVDNFFEEIIKDKLVAKTYLNNLQRCTVKLLNGYKLTNRNRAALIEEFNLNLDGLTSNLGVPDSQKELIKDFIGYSCIFKSYIKKPPVAKVLNVLSKVTNILLVLGNKLGSASGVALVKWGCVTSIIGPLGGPAMASLLISGVACLTIISILFAVKYMLDSYVNHQVERQINHNIEENNLQEPLPENNQLQEILDNKKLRSHDGIKDLMEKNLSTTLQDLNIVTSDAEINEDVATLYVYSHQLANMSESSLPDEVHTLLKKMFVTTKTIVSNYNTANPEHLIEDNKILDLFISSLRETYNKRSKVDKFMKVAALPFAIGLTDGLLKGETLGTAFLINMITAHFSGLPVATSHALELLSDTVIAGAFSVPLLLLGSVIFEGIKLAINKRDATSIHTMKEEIKTKVALLLSNINDYLKNIDNIDNIKSAENFKEFEEKCVNHIVAYRIIKKGSNNKIEFEEIKDVKDCRYEQGYVIYNNAASKHKLRETVRKLNESLAVPG